MLLETLLAAALAAPALALAPDPAPRAGGDVDALRKALEENKDDYWDGGGVRRKAVEELGGIGSRAAWELVVGALADINPRVCDTAQLQLGRLDDTALLLELYAKRGLESKEDWIRLRVAEAFGRMQIPVDGEALVKGLADRDAEVRRAIAWSLERLAERDGLTGDRARKILPAVQKAYEKDKEPCVRGALLYALHALDASAARLALAEAFGDKKEEVRMAAVAVAARYPEPLNDLRRMAGDSALRVRTQAAKCLAGLETKAAVAVLIERLAVEPEKRLKWILVDELQALSGMKFRLDPRPWQGWLQRQDEDWRPVRAQSSRAEPGQGERSVALAGLPILSGRIAFLIDSSGSIYQEREGGKTRKQLLDVKFREALLAVPEDTLFNLMFFTEEMFPWNKRLIDAKPANIKRGLEFFETFNTSGRGNVYDAIMLALEDPDVDTIVVVGDGAPSGGHRGELEMMIPLLMEKNRFRQVTFDSLLIDSSNRLKGHWGDLSERTGGRSVSFEFEQ